RRALVRDKLVSASARTRVAIGKTRRDLSHRAAGLAAGATSPFGDRQEASDEVLAERVRSRVGRYCSHASSLEVAVHDGKVTLGGPILAEEVNDVLRAAAAVPGVSGVEDRLEVYEEPGNVSGLQGQGRRPGLTPNFLRANWAPATRLLAGTAGFGLMAYALRRRTPAAALVGTAGLGLFLRGLTNLEFKQMLGVGEGGRGISRVKTIHIAAPVERVFEIWSRYVNFPQFMTHVREVRDLGGGRSHWTLNGPAGIRVEWDAEVTRTIPDQLLAWKTLPGSQVAHRGTVRFDPTPDGGTRVQVQLSYTPPAGLFGHAAAALLGADPKRLMDDDLMRMKTFIETGHPPHDAAAGHPRGNQGRRAAEKAEPVAAAAG
ncbi:MAG TPA: SRPBCC family protein, partial [Gemmataceae bacterium]